MPTPDGVARELDVPILMYHYICTPPTDADDVRIDLSTSPETFHEQLAALDAAGYTTITLYDLVFALQTGQTLPDKPIILTFDDGYRDNYENAFPILQEYDMVATFFVITGYLDEGRPDYVTWEQVAEMSQAGMSIESHSYNHADLSGKDVDYLVWQILGPKQAIEERTGVPVRFFCYPGGSYDELVIDVLKSANYWGATTVNQDVIQSNEGLFELSRIRVRSSYTGQDLLDVIDDFMEGTD